MGAAAGGGARGEGEHVGGVRAGKRGDRRPMLRVPQAHGPRAVAGRDGAVGQDGDRPDGRRGGRAALAGAGARAGARAEQFPAPVGVPRAQGAVRVAGDQAAAGRVPGDGDGAGRRARERARERERAVAPERKHARRAVVARGRHAFARRMQGQGPHGAAARGRGGGRGAGREVPHGERRVEAAAHQRRGAAAGGRHPGERGQARAVGAGHALGKRGRWWGVGGGRGWRG